MIQKGLSNLKLNYSSALRASVSSVDWIYLTEEYNLSLGPIETKKSVLHKCFVMDACTTVVLISWFFIDFINLMDALFN